MLKRFLLLRPLLASTSLSLPVAFHYWNSRGLSDADIGTLFAMFSFFLFILEPLSGIIGDQLARRSGILISIGLTFMGSLLILVGADFYQFVVGELVIALGVSMLTGTDQCYLYEALERRGSTSRFARYWGIARSLDLSGALIFGLLSSPLVLLSPSAPLTASTAGWCLALVVALRLPVDQPPLLVARESLWHQLKTTIALAKEKNTVGIVLVGGAIIVGASLTEFLLQPRLKEIGITVSNNGVVYAVGALLSILGALACPAVGRLLSPFGLVVLVAMSSVLCLFAGTLYSGIGASSLIFSVFFLMKGIGIVAYPLWLQSRVATEARATAQSLSNSVGRLVSSMATSVAATMLVTGETSKAFGIAAVFSAVSLFIALLRIRRVRIKTTEA